MGPVQKSQTTSERLAALRDRRCKETEATIAAALDGNYQEEHLFELKVAVEMFDAYSVKIQECELAGQSVLQELAGDDYVEPERQASDRRIRSNGFSFNPQALITSVTGHDLDRCPADAAGGPVDSNKAGKGSVIGILSGIAGGAKAICWVPINALVQRRRDTDQVRIIFKRWCPQNSAEVVDGETISMKLLKVELRNPGILSTQIRSYGICNRFGLDPILLNEFPLFKQCPLLVAPKTTEELPFPVYWRTCSLVRKRRSFFVTTGAGRTIRQAMPSKDIDRLLEPDESDEPLTLPPSN